MNIFHSTSSHPLETIQNLHYSRRLLLNSPLQPSQSPPPTYQALDPAHSSHGNSSFDANILMILGVLVCALISSLFINTFIRCVIKCSRVILGEPNYYLSIINHGKNKACGLDKRALKTFPVVKYSKEEKILRLSSECVICLSEFKGCDRVRVLPICNHGFHVKCIDKWLNSHSSCPTCRQSFVDTCKKIIGCGDAHQVTTSPLTPPLSPRPPPPSTSSREVYIVSIVPLEREDLVREYRSEVDDS